MICLFEKSKKLIRNVFLGDLVINSPQLFTYALRTPFSAEVSRNGF